MGRPRTPLISRRKTLETALRIIDAEGLEALSVRRLAEDLGVNAASLYHHFKNKDEILIGVAELALADVRTPQDDFTDGWKVWMPRNARGLRNAIRNHPAVLPIVIARSASGMGSTMLDSTARRLMAEGLPSAAVMPLLDALEFFAIGSALHEIEGGKEHVRGDRWGEDNPSLAKAMIDRGLSSDEIFDLVATSIVEGVVQAIESQQAKWAPPAVVDVPAAAVAGDHG